MAKKLLLLNGPNLNLLGTREPAVYGKETLADIEQAATAQAMAAGATLSCFQSNHECALIDRIHAAKSAFNSSNFNLPRYVFFTCPSAPISTV